MMSSVDSVAYIIAQSMIPVYEKQIEYYEQRLKRHKIQAALSGSTAMDFFIRGDEAGLMHAQLDLKLAQAVVREYEQRKGKGTSVQDASDVLSDQGQSEGSHLQERQG